MALILILAWILCGIVSRRACVTDMRMSGYGENFIAAMGCYMFIIGPAVFLAAMLISFWTGVNLFKEYWRYSRSLTHGD